MNNIYSEAWRILYNSFGERMQQKELDLMDGVLKSVKSDEEERLKWLSEQEGKTDIES